MLGGRFALNSLRHKRRYGFRTSVTNFRMWAKASDRVGEHDSFAAHHAVPFDTLVFIGH